MQLTTFKFLAMAWLLLICELKSTYILIFSIACNIHPHGHFLDSTVIVFHKNNGHLLLNSVTDSKLVIDDATYVTQYHIL
jgi:hypothetical protein